MINYQAIHMSHVNKVALIKLGFKEANCDYQNHPINNFYLNLLKESFRHDFLESIFWNIANRDRNDCIHIHNQGMYP